jgi:hypothetical protein
VFKKDFLKTFHVLCLATEYLLAITTYITENTGNIPNSVVHQAM